MQIKVSHAGQSICSAPPSTLKSITVPTLNRTGSNPADTTAVLRHRNLGWAGRNSRRVAKVPAAAIRISGQCATIPIMAAKKWRSVLISSWSLWCERQGQRREPAADDVPFVSERIGWLPFAAPSCWGCLFVRETLTVTGKAFVAVKSSIMFTFSWPTYRV
jgi:hypothetical protein